MINMILFFGIAFKSHLCIVFPKSICLQSKFFKKVICYQIIKWGYIIHLFCNCWEFENVLGFIKHTGTLIHINYHVHTSLTTEEILEEACQLTVSEGNDLGIISTKGNNRMSRTESIAVLSLTSSVTHGWFSSILSFITRGSTLWRSLVFNQICMTSVTFSYPMKLRVMYACCYSVSGLRVNFARMKFDWFIWFMHIFNVNKRM